MKKEDIVRNNREFNNIIKNGNYKKNNEFVIYYIDNELDHSRFGISVSKKIGNAVTRNYYKRIIRNICHKNKNLYSKGKDYIIIMRKGLTLLSFDKVNDSYIDLINKINK
jgi:ribonuclease P protein component